MAVVQLEPDSILPSLSISCPQAFKGQCRATAAYIFWLS